LQAVHETTRYPRPFGKYLLLRQLAVGGMAEVYLARQSGPAGFEKECVIKRILPSLAEDQQFVNMFLDEARIAARLSHPNIVQIFDLGAIGEGDYFLAMEHVHGVDLQHIIDAEAKGRGRLPLAIAVRLCSSVAEGLEHAHNATDSRGQRLGLVHRDVTPSNVIVSFDGVAKILDFGIAKAVARKGRTEVGVIKGKIPYMSPEQVNGEALDARSDVFSLGTVLYELTTGKKPFEGEGPADLSLKILQDTPRPPESFVEGYPERLGAIVRRAMAKKPGERSQSAREVHEALDDFLMTSGIRCTSHDVAGYLDGLFPGLRERARDEATLPIEVTDPTVPMQFSSSRPKTGPDAAAGPLMVGELPMPSMDGMEDARRTFGGGGRGGGSTVVVVLLLAAVAVGFWYLTVHNKGASEAQPATTPAPATATTAPPAAAKPEVTTGAAPAAAAPAAPAVKNETKTSAPDKQAELPSPAPLGAKPALPSAHEADHKKPHPKPHKAEPPRSLPRLPTPPPPDDGN
jgi:serine/threonine-protein kinase